MSQNRAIIALDVGEKRIGVAVADGVVPIARRLTTIDVDGSELRVVVKLLSDENAGSIVVGYPRNQSGEATAQTKYVEDFVGRLEEVTEAKIIYQDESLTSVIAENSLRSFGKPYTKSDIDAEAATLILQDYLERR